MKRTHFLINSVVKAFQVLEILSLENELSVSEVSKRMQFERSKGHRILATLKEIGYLNQNPLNKKYSISSKLFELGRRYIDENPLVGIAHPVMESLAVETGETVNLGVLEGNEVVCIDKVSSTHALKMDQPIGGKAGAYCTGFGKAILAFLPEKKIQEMFNKTPLKRYTKNTLTEFGMLLRELSIIRKRGYATDNEEFYLGIRCVGSPIFNYDGNVIAGMSVSGPSIRIKKKDFPKFAKLLVKATKSISQKIGWRC
jgi:DNA-binding IclR family transcriptional regulator